VQNKDVLVSGPYVRDGYTGMEYSSCNILAVEVKTEATATSKGKWPKTHLRLINLGSTQWAMTMDEHRTEHPDEIELELTGDSECDMLIDALRFAADQLEKQQSLNQIKWNHKRKQG
jgi:hypothetical protein